MPSIAQLQRQRLEALQAFQPNRPILVQPLAADPEDQKNTPWVRASTLREDEEVWTRSVLLSEALFDADVKPWWRAAAATHRIVAVLRELGIPHEVSYSGGKGTHTSVFLDGKRIHIDRGLAREAKRLGVDVWKEARLVVANAFLDAAEYGESDSDRWAPPVGEGPWDRLKVKWSAERNGSMVRMLGTPGSTGRTKALVPTRYDWSQSREPPNDFVHITDLGGAPEPEPWEVPKPLVQKIIEAIQVATGRARRRAASADKDAEANPLLAAKKLKRVPCAFRVLEEPAPPGTRHYAFLNLVVTCKKLGLPKKAAEAYLARALELCGLGPTDPAWEIVDEVYSDRYVTPTLKCPSPHVKAWCDPNKCCLAERFEFS